MMYLVTITCNASPGLDLSDQQHSIHGIVKILKWKYPFAHLTDSLVASSRHKRSINEIDDGSEEAYTDELLNSPLHQLDLGKIQKYPRIREFFIRNGSLYILFLCLYIREFY